MYVYNKFMYIYILLLFKYIFEYGFYKIIIYFILFLIIYISYTYGSYTNCMIHESYV